MAGYLPTREAERVLWFGNFKDVCFANQAALDLSPAEFTEIETVINDYIAAFDAANDAKLAAIAATATKNEADALATSTISPFALEFKNNPSVSVALKALLGLNTSITPSGPVVAPTSVAAEGKSNGVITVTWNRNGNAPKTTFIIQSKPLVGGEWTNLGVATATKFVTSAFEPGTAVQFRVLAFRGGETSEPSNSSAIDGSETESEMLEAA